MEMHSQESLYAIHGISVKRQRHGSRLIARRFIARILTFLTKVGRAIEAELAARQAMTELAEMSDHMLRDLGITRNEIASAVRRPRANVATDDTSIPLNDIGEHVAVLPAVNSPGIASEARAEQELRRLHPLGWG